MNNENRYSVYGAFGFVLGEFCRQFPDETIRIPKHDVEPQSNKIIYGISTTHNYHVYDQPTLDIETNLLHLMDVLDACHKKYGKDFEFNFISSWFVYGKQVIDDSQIIREFSQCNPQGFYSITKRAAEQLLVSYCNTFDIQFKILRLAGILGAKDTGVSKQKNAFQYLVDKLVHNEDIEIYYGGDFYRDYMDVRDCAKAIKLVSDCLIQPGTSPIFNVTSGKSQKFKDMIDLAVLYSGSKSNIWDKTDTSFHSVVQVKNFFSNNDKLVALGYKPEFTIEQTIKDIVDAYKGR